MDRSYVYCTIFCTLWLSVCSYGIVLCCNGELALKLALKPIRLHAFVLSRHALLILSSDFIFIYSSLMLIVPLFALAQSIPLVIAHSKLDPLQWFRVSVPHFL